jgi:hypothetical protein
MIIAGTGGGFAPPLFKDTLGISNNTKQVENTRALSLGGCNIA